MARKSSGKRLRFEIFKRDGFRCVYCGATPVDSPLHIDHVTPLAAGGTDDPDNLATACQNCNAGKGPVPLSDKKLGSHILTDADRDHVEQIREYLAVQRQIAEARRALADEFLDYWQDNVEGAEKYVRREILSGAASLVRNNSLESLFEAVDIVSRKGLSELDAVKYFFGILRRRKAEKCDPAP